MVREKIKSLFSKLYSYKINPIAYGILQLPQLRGEGGGEGGGGIFIPYLVIFVIYFFN